MSIPTLPNELLMLIVKDLDSQTELNALLQTNSRLYYTLNDYLYLYNVRHNQASALWWAAKHGSESTLQKLLEAGADVRWQSPFSHTPQTAPKFTTPKEHPISYSAMNGHEAFSSKLLDLGVDVDYQDPEGRTPLSLAARGGHLPVVKMLASRGASQVSRDIFGLSPIGNAASQGRHEVADFLLQERRQSGDADETEIQAEIQNMLMLAARRGDNDRITQLLTQNIDVNFQSHADSCTPLCVASKNGHVSTVQLLLEHNANPNFLVGGDREHTPLECAVDGHKSDRIIPLLIEHGADARQSGGRAMYYALLQGKTNEFQLLVECNERLDSWSPWSKLVSSVTSGISSAVDTIMGSIYPSQSDGKIRSAGRFAEEALLDYLKTCVDTQE